MAESQTGNTPGRNKYHEWQNCPPRLAQPIPLPGHPIVPQIVIPQPSRSHYCSDPNMAEPNFYIGSLEPSCLQYKLIIYIHSTTKYIRSLENPHGQKTLVLFIHWHLTCLHFPIGWKFQQPAPHLTGAAARQVKVSRTPFPFPDYQGVRYFADILDFKLRDRRF